jgi:solute carrier family 10 (sodium/bile acid cotransporter), member 7
MGERSPAIPSRVRRAAGHWFVPALLAALLLGLLFPRLGARGGPLRPEITASLAVAAIFLLHGLSLPPAALRAGAAQWRLHTVVQLFIFVAFPLGVVVFDMAAGSLLPIDLRTGFIFLAILPTTIAASVAYTAAAGGNTSAALFNAAVANVAGVIVTPLWASALLQARGDLPPVTAMIGSIALLLVVPLTAGQLLRPLLRRVWEPDSRLLGTIANIIILYIVFVAFAGSVDGGAFRGVAVTVLLIATAAAVLIFALSTVAAVALGRVLRFDAPERSALTFCASQKTLAAGAPIAQVLFAAHAGLGVILLPLIIYHTVQLVGGAALMPLLRGSAARPNLLHERGQPVQ